MQIISRNKLEPVRRLHNAMRITGIGGLEVTFCRNGLYPVHWSRDVRRITVTVGSKVSSWYRDR